MVGRPTTCTSATAASATSTPMPCGGTGIPWRSSVPSASGGSPRCSPCQRPARCWLCPHTVPPRLPCHHLCLRPAPAAGPGPWRSPTSTTSACYCIPTAVRIRPQITCTDCVGLSSACKAWKGAHSPAMSPFAQPSRQAKRQARCASYFREAPNGARKRLCRCRPRPCRVCAGTGAPTAIPGSSSPPWVGVATAPPRPTLPCARAACRGLFARPSSRPVSTSATSRSLPWDSPRRPTCWRPGSSISAMPSWRPPGSSCNLTQAGQADAYARINALMGDLRGKCHPFRLTFTLPEAVPSA